MQVQLKINVSPASSVPLKGKKVSWQGQIGPASFFEAQAEFWALQPLQTPLE